MAPPPPGVFYWTKKSVDTTTYRVYIGYMDINTDTGHTTGDTMENQALTMRVGYKVLDWDATEQKARTMDKDQLWFAYLDCVRTAEATPDQDQGYYHDQASVYYRELCRRHGVANPTVPFHV